MPSKTDHLDKHGRLFHLISPIYRLFFNYQIKEYQEILNDNSEYLGVKNGASILDVGCGTGAFSYCLAKMGFKVTGVDVAPGMIHQADKLDCGGSLSFIIGDVSEALKYDDKSFDLVTAAYVAHGFDSRKRIKMYYELARLTKKRIILQDFNDIRSLPITLIEWMEGGGYFQFIKEGLFEMERVFKIVNVIPVSKQLNWYILEP